MSSVDANSTASAAGADEEGAPRPGPDLSELDLHGPRANQDAAVIALDEEPASDGRVARGQRTRRNVADALVSLLAEGDAEPTARAVAERAGVSLRLVFHHFADMDDLYHYVAALQLRYEWSTLARVSPDLDLPTRVDRTAAERAVLFERVGPVRRAIARRTSSPGVKRATAAADALLLEHLKDTFTPELDALSEAERAERLEAVDTVASWEAWDRMRRTSGLQVRAAQRVMARLLLSCCREFADPDMVRAAVGAAAPAR
jgi:AcrR family transcriptional regulator